jgi:alpha-beta hydrolase superfamily lysophospholipase
MSRVALTLTFSLALASTAGAQRATPGVPPDTLLAYTGVFRMGAAHDVAIAPFRTPSGWMLLLADVQTDALRFLTPTGQDSFTTGSETLPSAQIESRISAVRDGAIVRSMTVKAEAATTSAIARRISVDVLPITFTSGAIRINGYVYRPSGARHKLPLVALAHGSEDSDRYSFGPIPLVLASQGFAVLAYDKRGTGTSTGDWSPAGLEELADDLAAGIRAVRERPDIDPKRIAVLGVSEGGWIAPIVASRLPGIRAIAAISGGARTKGDAYIHKIRQEQHAAGASAATRDSALKDAERLIAESARRVAARESPRGFDRRVSFDPTEHWRRYKGPVLYMGGEADVLESGPAAAEWFNRLAAESGNLDVTVRLWPRAHHSLLLGVTGEPSEFRTLRGIKQLAPGYWDVLLRWLGKHVASAEHVPPHQLRHWVMFS